MKVYGFYHVCLINNWEEVVANQVSKIKNSRLFSITDEIYTVVLGERKNLSLLADLSNNVEYYDNISLFEFPTLEKIKDLSEKEDFYCWYIHTKGVGLEESTMSFYHGATDFDHLKSCVNDWREYMEYFIIDKFDSCLFLLSKDHDACGVNLVDDPSWHFSGNFWWAKSDYIKKLPDIDSLDKEFRWNAELWIGMGDGRLKSLYNNDDAGYRKRLSLDYKKV